MSNNVDQQSHDPKRYERIKMLVGLVNLAIYILVPVVVLVTGASADIRDFISDQTAGIVVLGAIVYIVLASVALEVATLPLGYFSGHILERRYGLTRRTVFGWAEGLVEGVGIADGAARYLRRVSLRSASGGPRLLVGLGFVAIFGAIRVLGRDRTDSANAHIFQVRTVTRW